MANALSFYQDAARRRELHPVGAAHRARAPQRRERDDLLDAAATTRLRAFLRRPHPARRRGSTPPAAGGTPATTSSSCRRRATRSTCCSRASATSRRRWAPASSNFTAEAKFGTDWLLRMWDDPTQTLYYQVGIGEGNAKTSATTTSGGCRRPTTPTAAPTPLYRYIRNRPVFRAGPPGSLISPNLAGRDAAALARVLPGLQDASDPAFANRCLLAAEHIFDLANTAPDRQPADGDPVQLLSRDRVARRPGARRHRAVLRAGRRRHCRPACRTPIRCSTCSRPRTGRTPTSPGPNDAADTLNLYDVSAGSPTTSCYRAIAQAGNPPGLDDDTAPRCWRT